MRAAVVVPPVRDFYFTPQRASFLGARAVGAVLERLGHDVDYHFFPASGKVKPVDLPRALGYLDAFLIPGERGPTSFFTRYRRFGPPFPLCAERVLGIQSDGTPPDMVLVSSIAYCYLEDTLELAREIRRIRDDIPLIAGGPGVSVAAKRLRATGLFDALVSGEAEGVLPEVLEQVLEEVSEPGNAGAPRYRPSNQMLAFGPPVESPPLVYALRRTRRRSYVTIQLTRGCPYACTFCSTHLTSGRRLRRVPLSQVQRGLAGIDTDGAVHVNIEDDNLLTDRAYAWEAFRLLGERWSDLTISAENGLDYRHLRDGDVSRLAAAGFRAFNFTLASADGSVRHRQERHGGLEKLVAAIEESAACGVRPVTYFICGLPGDSPDSVIDTMAVLATRPTLLGISPFYPVPGLVGFENLADDERVAPQVCAGSSNYPWTATLSTGEMVTAFRLSRLVNLAKKDHRSAWEDALLRCSFARKRVLTLSPAIAVPPGVDADMERRFFSMVSLATIR